ncbi:hypothetical protein BpHYR1_010090 [Brachionus plicatilis]|uniref:Uncharacterized protein n=1 Tax=Brachionus plicatilis TaxID=10195 RepID=A0A3M7QS42_BRAPC|nr:hypothetical protein BpHYR1_010090 [Brachionus plicatilis]
MTTLALIDTLIKTLESLTIAIEEALDLSNNVIKAQMKTIDACSRLHPSKDCPDCAASQITFTNHESYNAVLTSYSKGHVEELKSLETAVKAGRSPGPHHKEVDRSPEFVATPRRLSNHDILMSDSTPTTSSAVDYDQIYHSLKQHINQYGIDKTLPNNLTSKHLKEIEYLLLIYLQLKVLNEETVTETRRRILFFWRAHKLGFAVAIQHYPKSDTESEFYNTGIEPPSKSAKSSESIVRHYHYNVPRGGRGNQSSTRVP